MSLHLLEKPGEILIPETEVRWRVGHGPQQNLEVQKWGSSVQQEGLVADAVFEVGIKNSKDEGRGHYQKDERA